MGLPVFESADEPVTIGRTISPLPLHHVLHKVAFILITIGEHESSPSVRLAVGKVADIFVASRKQIRAATMWDTSRQWADIAIAVLELQCG